MSAIDQINQGGTTYEIVPEIAELFSIEKTYRAGDHVIYEAGWYTFKTDKYAGAWDATKVDGPFKVTNELSSLKSDISYITEKMQVKYGLNRYNSQKFVQNTHINSTTGGIESSSSVGTTGLIPVEPNTQYRFFSDYATYYSIFEVAAYDANKNYISNSYSSTRTSIYTVPSNAHYIQCCIANTLSSDFMVIASSDGLPSAYVPYYEYYVAEDGFLAETIDNTLSVNGKIAEAKAVGDKIATLATLEQFNRLIGSGVDTTGVTTESGYFIHGGNGDKISHTAEIYGCSDYINISDYKSMKLQITALFNGTAGIAFYTADKTFISGITGTQIGNSAYLQTIIASVPTNASYLRITIKATESTDISHYPIKYVGDMNAVCKAINDLKTAVSDLSGVTGEYASLSMFEKFGVVGDSYASGEIFVGGSGTDYYELSWGQNIARMCGNVCTNYSKGGLTTKTWLSNVTYGLSKLLSDEPQQLYLLCLGLNDSTAIGQGTYSLGTIADINQDYTQNPDTFYGNYGRIIGNIQSHAPNAKVIICTVTEGNANDFATVNTAISAIAEELELPLMNLKEDDFFLSAFYRNCMASNHPTAISYSAYAKGIMRLFSKCASENIDYFKDYVG